MADLTRPCKNKFVISIHYVSLVVAGHDVALRVGLRVVLSNNLLHILFTGVYVQSVTSGRWIKFTTLLSLLG